jgi:hypothetical protein
MKSPQVTTDGPMNADLKPAPLVGRYRLSRLLSDRRRRFMTQQPAAARRAKLRNVRLERGQHFEDVANRKNQLAIGAVIFGKHHLSGDLRHGCAVANPGLEIAECSGMKLSLSVIGSSAIGNSTILLIAEPLRLRDQAHRPSSAVPNIFPLHQRVIALGDAEPESRHGGGALCHPNCTVAANGL